VEREAKKGKAKRKSPKKFTKEPEGSSKGVGKGEDSRGLEECQQVIFRKKNCKKE